MSTAATPQAMERTRRQSASRGIPFGRLLLVELRKMVDTRSGRWLLATIAGLALVVLVAMIFIEEVPRTFAVFAQAATVPVGILLPVVGILTMTSEWSQRTALVTFSLEPRRARVIAAKSLAALLVTIGVLALVLLLSAAALAIAGLRQDVSPTWAPDSATRFGLSLIPHVIGMVMGLAFGLLLTNSAAAIVIYYVLPLAVQMLFVWDKARPVLEWAGPEVVSRPFGAADVTTQQWQQAATSGAIWILIPFVVGTLITLRREAK